MGAFEDNVQAKRLDTKLIRRSTAQDQGTARQMLADADISHTTLAENMRKATEFLNDDLQMAPAVVQNLEDTTMETGPTSFLRGVLRDMETKAFMDNQLEKELLEQAKEKSGKEPTPKKKPLWSMKMSLRTREVSGAQICLGKGMAVAGLVSRI